MVAQGAKPIGPICQVISDGRDQTLGAIQMDDIATQQLKEAGALDYDSKDSIMADADVSTRNRLLNVESLMIRENTLDVVSTVVDVVQRLQLAIEASRTTMGQTSVSSRRLIEILLDI